MADNADLSGVLGHLYVRLRRDCGRVIDAVYAARNAEYAAEVIKLARTVKDPEVEKLVSRYEELMLGIKRPQAAAPAPASAPAAAAPTDAEIDTMSATGRYRAGLR